eukprot:7257063-Prymnesium_polylepis.1
MQPSVSGSVTPQVAQQLFVAEGFNTIRLPIWGMHAHWTEGETDGRYYHSQVSSNYNAWPAENVTFSLGDNGGGAIESAAAAQAANPNVQVMMSLKLNEGTSGWSWPSWCVAAGTFMQTGTAPVVIPSEYAHLLADYMQYLRSQGVDPKGWLLSPNTEMAPYTAGVHQETIQNLSARFANLSIYVNMPFGDYYAKYHKILQLRDSPGGHVTVDVFSYHNYGKYRDFRRNELLLMFAALHDVGLPSFFSEVHSLGQDTATHADGSSCVTDIDNAEDMLAHMHDCFYGGTQSFVWWAYKGSEKGCSPFASDPAERCTHFNREIKWWMVHSAPVGAEMILMDDHDGRIMRFGTLMTAAWRTGSRVSMWVVNNEPNITCGAAGGGNGRTGDGTTPESMTYTFQLMSGWQIEGDVTIYQYVGPFVGTYGMVKVQAMNQPNRENFTMPVPAYSLSVADFTITRVSDSSAREGQSVSTFASTDSALLLAGSNEVSIFDGSLVVDGTDRVAFFKFGQLLLPAPVVKATLRVYAETA